jgi:hypothetical protein
MALLECLNNEIKKKRPKLKRKSAVSLRQSPVSQSIKRTAKLLLLHPPYAPDMAQSDFFLFADLKRMLAGKNLALIKR